jgi:hypothetical protein
MQNDVYRLLSCEDALNQSSLAQPWVKLFLSHVALLPTVPMEYSLKWSGDKVSGQRPTIGFKSNVQAYWNWCLDRIEHYEFGANGDALRRRLKACPLDTMTMLLYGIDVGPNLASSRVKLHLDISGPADADSAARRSLLSWLVQEEGLPEDLLIKGQGGRLLLGLDVMGSGEIVMRAYVSYDDPILYKSVWQELFADELAHKLANSPAVAFAWKGQEAGTHMYVLDLSGLQEKLIQTGISGLESLNSRTPNAPAYIVGASQTAWASHHLDVMTSYHMLPRQWPTAEGLRPQV